MKEATLNSVTGKVTWLLIYSVLSGDIFWREFIFRQFPWLVESLYLEESVLKQLFLRQNYCYCC